MIEQTAEQTSAIDSLLDEATDLRAGGMAPGSVSEVFLRAALTICVSHHGLDVTVATLRRVADQFEAADEKAGYQLQ